MALTAFVDAFPAALHSASPAFRAFSQFAAPMVFTAVWQGIAIASALALCLRVAPRISAAHRFTLWSAGFLALVFLPFLHFLTSFTAASASIGPSPVAAASAHPWLQIDIRWSFAIAALWAAASVFRAIDLLTHSFHIRRLWKSATPTDSPASLFNLASRDRRPVQLCTTRDLDRPSVIGFLAPRILIPDWLFARLTPGELDQIVLHESEHLRRGDDWTNLFQKLCLILCPLNPALWWMERRLCKEREMACDDAVIRVTRAPRAYAACLTSLAERGLNRNDLERSVEALSLGAWQRRPELAHRVDSILLRKHALSPLATRTLLGAVSCGLLIGSVELARCPQFIALAPARHAVAAQALASSPRQNQPARLLAASYTPHRPAAATPAFRAPAFRTIATVAKMPAPTRARHATPLAPEQEADAKSYDAVQTDNHFAELADAPLQQQILKAESAPLPASSHAQERTQEWIVLTAWEQVQTSAGAAPQSTGESAGQSASPAAKGPGAQPNGQVTRRITVTRLIFRVLPAASVSGQPVAVPIRNGWLVFEL